MYFDSVSIKSNKFYINIYNNKLLKKIYKNSLFLGSKPAWSLKVPNDIRILILIEIWLNPRIYSNWFIKNWLNRSKRIL